MEAARLDAHIFSQFIKEYKLSSCVVITFQVMAIPGVSAGHPHPVRPVPKGGQDQFGAHPCGTGHPDDPEIRRVLQPAHARQVRGPVTAPVAQERRYLGLSVIHTLAPEHVSLVMDHLTLDIRQLSVVRCPPSVVIGQLSFVSSHVVSVHPLFIARC